MNARSGRFPLFDSLRAVAAFLIVAFHCVGFAGGAPFLPAVFAHFEIGVPIFFVISGFLLYRPYVAARAEGRERPATAAYAWRRFLRIVPAYWVALTIVTIVGGTATVFSLAGIPINYGFAQFYSGRYASGEIPQAWTLTVEVTFYALLPLLALAMRRTRSMRSEVVVLTALVIASFAYNAGMAFGHSDGWVRFAAMSQLYSLPGSFVFFGAGMLMAVASVALAGREVRWVSFVDRRPAAMWAIALVAFGAFVLINGGENGGVHSYTPWEWMAHQLLYAVAAAAFVSVAVFGDQTRGLVRRVLAFRPLLYLGMVSYGVYLWHFFLLRKLSDWGLGGHEVGSTYLTWFLVGSAFAVIVASVSYYVVERPALSLKRLVPSSRGARPRDAIAEPAPAVPAAVGPPSE